MWRLVPLRSSCAEPNPTRSAQLVAPAQRGYISQPEFKIRVLGAALELHSGGRAPHWKHHKYISTLDSILDFYCIVGVLNFYVGNTFTSESS